MSQSIDERIVEMRFNNRDFESNVATSMTTLEKFEKKLNFLDAGKALSDLGKAAGQFSLSGLTDAASAVEVKFSAMSIAAITAIQNIVNKAVDAGEKLVKSLSVDNIADGWKKFGDKTTSVATLVSQGYKLENVNEQLDRLNWFTDETSYNFTDMVSNIAKFTATGQELQPSVTAMEGIATWAALSGQSATTASRAMYQLSQAMSKGALKYDDFKSIQNANMDTKEFREQSLAAAEALGVLKKNANDTYTVIASGKSYSMAEMFASESLTREAWFTSDVMMDVFGKYSSAVDQIYEYAEEHGITASEAIAELGDQVDAFGLKAFKSAQEARTWTDVIDSVKDAVSTGWMKTFELIIGDYDEAKTLYTQMANDLYDIFAGGGESRNELLYEGLTSGWKKFLKEGISDAADFKNEIRTVAADAGIAIDDIIDEAGSFEESLHSGWLTADILTTSVSNLADRLSGLSEEELKASGYSEEQLEALIALNDGLKDGSINAEEYAKSMAAFSGRDNLVQSLWNMRDALFLVDEETGKATGIIAVFKEALHEIFPPMTAEQLYAITEGLRNFTSRLILSEDKAEKFKSVFKGVLSVFDILGQIVKAVFRTLSPLIGLFTNGAGEALDFASGIGDVVANFAASAKESDFFFNRIQDGIEILRKARDKVIEFGAAIDSKFQGLTGMTIAEAFSEVRDTVSGAIDKVREFISLLFPSSTENSSTFTNFYDADKFAKLKSIAEDTSSVFEKLKDAVAKAFDKIAEAIAKVLEAISNVKAKVKDFIGNFSFDTIIAGAKKLWEILKLIGNGIKSVFSAIGDKLKEAFGGIENLDLSVLSDLAGAGALGGIAVGLFKLVNSFTGIKDIVDNVGEVLDTVSSKLGSMTTTVSAKDLFKIAAAIAVLAVAILLLANVDGDKIATSLAVVTSAMGALVGSLAVISKISSASGKGGTSVNQLVFAMIGMSVALVIMTSALKKLSEMDSDAALKGIITLGIVMAELAFFAKKLDGVKLKVSTGVALIVIAASLLVFQKACEAFGEMDVITLGQGLIVMEILLASLAAFAKSVDGKKLLNAAVSMVIIGAAMKILASAVGDFGKLPLPQLGKGIGSVVVLLGALALFGKIVDDKEMLNAAIAMVAIGAAMKILVSAVKDFGEIPLPQLIQGIASVVVLLAALAGFSMVVSDKKMISASTSLVIVGAALKILASAVGDFGSIPLPQLIAGLIGMAVALGAIVAALLFMPKDAMLSAISLVVIGAAIKILADALTTLGGMSMGEIAKSLIALGGAIAVLIVAASLMGSVVGGIAAMMLAAIAVSMLVPPLAALGALPIGAIGKALLALGGALAIVIGAAYLAIPVVVPLLALSGALLIIAAAAAVFAAAAIELGIALTTISAGLTAFAAVLPTHILVFINSLELIVSSILAFIPRVVASLARAIAAVATALAAAIPAIMTLVEAIFSGALDLLIALIPKVVIVIGTLLDAVCELLLIYIPRLTEVLAELIVSFLTILAEYTPLIIDAGAELIINFLDGLTEALPGIIGSATDLIIAFIDGVANMAADIVDAGFKAIITFINGMADAISENSEDLVAAVEKLIQALLDAAVDIITGGFDLFHNLGEELLDSEFAQGIRDKIGSLLSTVSGFLSDMQTKISGKFTDFREKGKETMERFKAGISAKILDVKSKVGEVVTSALNKLQDKVEDFKQKGRNAIQGFINGMGEKLNAAVEKVQSIGSSVVSGLKNILGINSPSKVFRELGRYSDEGLALGFTDYAGRVANAASGVGSKAVSAMSDAVKSIAGALDGEGFSDPVIRPVLDLSNVEQGVGRISSLFSENQALSVGGYMNASRYVADTSGGATQPATMGSTFTFTQNNYSPKALSRVEIYRQTQNQLSTIEGVLKRA